MIEFAQGFHTYYVYIITNKNRTVLYTGITNNLHRRLHEHHTKHNPKSFSARYSVEFLIYYEKFTWIQEVIAREKEIKLLSRIRKLNLIRSANPNLDFLNYLFQTYS